MPLTLLQRSSVRVFAAFRRMLLSIADWICARPRLAAWVYRRDDLEPVESYREFNGRYFANFSQQEKMLADRPRMEFYHAAISRHIEPGDRVIDLGTGTGILAAFAARRGAAMVYAIDHSPILRHARTLAAANGIENVEFVATHSTDFHVEEPVDVIVHEQMGDCLFDEGMVANVTDLRDRLLKPGGLILPSVFEFYCEPVKLSDKRRVPFIWELNVHGYDYRCLASERPQEPEYYRGVSSDPTVVEHFLTEPAPALAIDLHTVEESQMPRAVTLTRPVVNAGRLDGYAIFFRARVDGDLCLGSSPLDPGRAPHWGFRILRAERMDFAAGDTIELRLTVGCWTDLDTWRWSTEKRSAQCAVVRGAAGA